MQSQQHSLEDLKAQRKTVMTAMNLPGIPADEMEIYRETIRSIDAHIAAIQSKKQIATPNPPPAPHSGAYGARPDIQHTTQGRTILAGGHSKTQDPITSKIELENNADRFNPTITITWSDGYKLTVDETAATGRFKSTFRDTLALKCVSEQRYIKMWRWDTPWRSAGFYKAITALREGIPPTLKDLGYTHPSDRQREVFALITQQAASVELA